LQSREENNHGKQRATEYIKQENKGQNAYYQIGTDTRYQGKGKGIHGEI
jgi:hypothetical protein